MLYTIRTDSQSASIEKDGDDWRVVVQTARDDSGLRKTIVRYFSVLSAAPDLGLLKVSKVLRQEFGITGTYQLVAKAA